MRLDLAERLRCPRPHAATPLVVVASDVVERELRRGVAGCPVCRFEARFERGDLIGDDVGAADDTTADLSLDRLIALLGLAEPGGAVLLLGAYASLASALAGRCEVAIITDRRAERRGPEDPASAIVGFGDAVPFNDGTFRAAALGASTSAAKALEAVRCTGPGGRVVGAASLSVPAGLRELARDHVEWVAEVEVRAAVVGLKRRS